METLILDNILLEKEQKEIYDFCKSRPYYRGEVDKPGYPPTGLVSPLENIDIIDKIMSGTNNKNKVIERAYINLFLPNEKPYFHIDNEDPSYKTLLYYVNAEEINWTDEGGETFFLEGNSKKAVSFLPGRIIIFDANISHRASSFRNLDRYTIALKFKNK
jgi:hypothetical protein|tara:strand:- start:551 stop:1030 length:480 start_codon:yes stop_codon:yes gene_type:complete